MYVHVCVRVCVCVNPWAKGSPPLTFPLFHFRPIFHLDRSRGQECHCKSPADQSGVPATVFELLPTLSNLFCLFPWCFHDTSPKRFFLQQLAAAARFCRLSPQSRETTDVKTPTIPWTIRHTVPSPFFPSWQLSLTENQCRSVDRSVFPLGYWV